MGRSGWWSGSARRRPGSPHRGRRRRAAGRVDGARSPTTPRPSTRCSRRSTDTGAAESADLAGVGHRVVHGGDQFTAPTLVDDEVIAGDRRPGPAGPAAQPGQPARHPGRPWRAFPDVPHVAVFDTAFHPTIPAARLHATPSTSRARPEHRIRRYGFHGTSHTYVTAQGGRACSASRPTRSTWSPCTWATAPARARSRGGRSVDTSMGLTPLEGLVMGTRSGDLDPAVVFHLHRDGRAVGRRGRRPAQQAQRPARPVRGERHARGARAWSPRATRTPSRGAGRLRATGSASTSARTWRCSAGSTRSCSPPASARTTPASGPASCAGWR